MEGSVGDVKVCELNWNADDKLALVQPPYDFVIAADCIYHENHMDDLLDTILKLTDFRSTGKCSERPCRVVNGSVLGQS